VVRERVGGVPIVLLGWSMGGYGALLAASDHPGKIAAVAAAAPALWPSFAQAASGAFDDEADFRRHDLFQRVRSLSRLPVHIYCGEDDRFSDRARAFADELPGADTDFGSGFHDVSSWRSRLPSQLEFFRRSLDR
jgi:pimeloyl-ACP methyl ester carboxylesterase